MPKGVLIFRVFGASFSASCLDMGSDMKPHRHAELIKAWADGAEIEARTVYNHVGYSDQWTPTFDPVWSNTNFEFRIKPKPRDNIVKFINVRLHYREKEICRWDLCDEQFANLKLVFDGRS